MYANPGSVFFFVQVTISAILTVVYRFRRALGAALGRREERDSDPQR